MDVERRRRKDDRSGGVWTVYVDVDCRARRCKPYCVEATCHLHRPHLEVGEYAVVRGSIGAGCHRLWLKAMPHDNDAF